MCVFTCICVYMSLFMFVCMCIFVFMCMLVCGYIYIVGESVSVFMGTQRALQVQMWVTTEPHSVLDTAWALGL